MLLNLSYQNALISEIVAISHKRKRSDECILEHAHGKDFIEIIYVDYGRVSIRIETNELILNPGDCIIIPGYSKHSFCGEPGAPFDYLNIMFVGSLPESVCFEPFSVPSNARKLMEILVQESEYKLPYYEDLIGALLSQILITFIREKENILPDKLPEAATRHLYRSDLVRRALAVIEKEYSSQLDLNKLGKAAGCSKSYLRNLIKRETGETFSEILQKHRIAAAKHLLRTTGRSLDEIACAVGYNSMPFFFKVFKRWTGMTPMEYSCVFDAPGEV